MDKVSIALELAILYRYEKQEKLYEYLENVEGSKEIYEDILDILKEYYAPNGEGNN